MEFQAITIDDLDQLYFAVENDPDDRPSEVINAIAKELERQLNRPQQPTLDDIDNLVRAYKASDMAENRLMAITFRGIVNDVYNRQVIALRAKYNDLISQLDRMIEG